MDAQTMQMFQASEVEVGIPRATKRKTGTIASGRVGLRMGVAQSGRLNSWVATRVPALRKPIQWRPP